MHHHWGQQSRAQGMFANRKCVSLCLQKIIITTFVAVFKIIVGEYFLDFYVQSAVISVEASKNSAVGNGKWI